MQIKNHDNVPKLDHRTASLSLRKRMGMRARVRLFARFAAALMFDIG